jgi:hypothetical protein
MSSNAENELLELAAKMHGFSSVTQYLMWKAAPDSLMRDIVADNRRGISNSASMLPPQPTKPVARGTGWVDPAPIRQPSGAEPGGLIDRMVENQDRQERQVKINMQMAEELRAFDLQQKLRDAELDPTGQLYSNPDDA